MDGQESAVPEVTGDEKKADDAGAHRWAIGIVVAVLAIVGICGWRISARDDVPVDPGSDARRVCEEEFIPKRLKAPKTAEFSNVTVSNSGDTYTVTGAVDAQNSFGALVRSSFTCVVRESGDNWVLQSATVG